MGKPDILTDAQLLGVLYPRACLVQDSSSSQNGSLPRLPLVDYDPRSNDIPCNGVVRELGSIPVTSLTQRVPAIGCLTQRGAGLCPRGLGLTDVEIKAPKNPK